METVQLHASPVQGGTASTTYVQATPVAPPRQRSHWGATHKGGVNFNPEGASPLACGLLSSAESVPGPETVERRKERYANYLDRKSHAAAVKVHQEEQQAMNAEALVLLESRVSELQSEVHRLKLRVNHLLQFAPPGLAGEEERLG